MTRTTRHVHRPQGDASPRVDQRTVTRVLGVDGSPIHETVEERTTPLTEEEQEHWVRDPAEEPEAEGVFQRSRETQLLRHVEHTPDGVVETRTLITSHVVPDVSMSVISDDAQNSSEVGSVIIDESSGHPSAQPSPQPPHSVDDPDAHHSEDPNQNLHTQSYDDLPPQHDDQGQVLRDGIPEEVERLQREEDEQKRLSQSFTATHEDAAEQLAGDLSPDALPPPQEDQQDQEEEDHHQHQQGHQSDDVVMHSHPAQLATSAGL